MSIPRRWRRVRIEELRTLWAAQEAAREVFNGCTLAGLAATYGAENVRHVMGRGFFKLTTSTN
jgi:hypothetical protein